MNHTASPSNGPAAGDDWRRFGLINEHFNQELVPH